MKKLIAAAIEAERERFVAISIEIGEHPELGHEEFRASALLAEELEKHGFVVERGTAGLPTAFTGIFDSGQPGPSIAFLAEYDALAGLGHACGHNLIGTMAIAAAIGTSKVLANTGGKLYVYGTPAEETRGGKVTMAEQGIFNHLDVALMAHPYMHYEKSGSSLAMDAIQFEFFGKAAHAAAAPHEGINALDAVIQTFNAINALRQQVTSDVRIHGIIAKGGDAANIIPDYAVAQFYVRAKTRKSCDQMTQRVIACAEGAALATGAKLVTSNYEFSYDELVTNEHLSQVFTTNLIDLGVNPAEIYEKSEGGSSDIGNVSLHIPVIHPYFKICDEPYACHTNEFREAALSAQGRDGMILAAKALAFTAYDLLTKPEILAQVKQEFALSQSK